MILKPAEVTPLTAIILADILYEAGLPHEMLQVVTGVPGDFGDEMITNKSFKMAPPAPALNFQIMHREQSLVPAGGGSAAAEAAPTQLTDLD